MLARITRWWHAVELVVWTGAASWIVRRYDLHPGWGVMLVIGAAVGLRLLLNAAAFSVAGWAASPRPPSARIPYHRRLALIVREAWVFSVAYAWEQMAPRRFGREGGRIPVGQTAARNPVLLVHGYLCNGGVWRRYVRWLEDAGFEVYTVSLEPQLGEIDSISRALEARIDGLLRNSPGERIDLVCHSMGGLVARAYLRRCGGFRIGRLITLGTPHLGTVLAWFGLGANARQMRQGSAWMTDPENAAGVAMPADRPVAIFTYDDNLVSPQANARLPSMQAVGLAGMGHLSLLASPAACAHVQAALRRQGGQGAGDTPSEVDATHQLA